MKLERFFLAILVCSFAFFGRGFCPKGEVPVVPRPAVSSPKRTEDSQITFSRMPPVPWNISPAMPVVDYDVSKPVVELNFLCSNCKMHVPFDKILDSNGYCENPDCGFFVHQNAVCWGMFEYDNQCGLDISTDGLCPDCGKFKIPEVYCDKQRCRNLFLNIFVHNFYPGCMECPFCALFRSYGYE